MQKLLLFSDPHLHGSEATGMEAQAAAHLKAAIAHAHAHHADAQHAVFCGDLSDAGTEGGYQTLKAICADLAAPATYLMGNEDDRDAFGSVFPEVSRASGFYQTALKFGTHTLLCLDTLDAAAEPKHSGVLCEDRCAWLKAELSAQADQTITVLMHHPPVRLGMPKMDAIGLRNGCESVRLLASGGVRRVIAGHVHRSVIADSAGLNCTTLPSTAFGIKLDTRGGELSLDPAHCPAYAVLLLSEDGIWLHTETFSGLETPAPRLG